MLVVIPFHEGDKWLAQRNIEWALKLDGGKVDFDCLLAYDTETDPADVRAAAATYFRNVHELKTDALPGDRTWPRGANDLWQKTAVFLYGFKWSNGSQQWLYWEPDATPVQKGWLTTLENEGIRGGKPFCGAIFPGRTANYMAGVGIYPRDVCHYSSDAFLVRSTPFDIALGVGAIKHVHAANHLIHHTQTVGGDSFSDTDWKEVIHPGVVLFHKCKDGSLIDAISGVAPKIMAPSKERPHKLSWTQQTDWPCGFFHFPATPGVTVYFNPTLATIGGADYLIPRRWVQFRPGMWKSDIGLCRIGKNMTLTDISFPAIPATVENENWEDPRAVVHDGTLYLSCVNWGGPSWRLVKMHQVFAKLVGNRLEVVWHPIYGHNRDTLKANAGHEKNWTWFRHDDSWHFVYQSSPEHRVVRYQGVLDVKEWSGKVKTGEIWKHGDLRGGSCPVRVGNEYFCFVHSSLPSRINRRTYFMGAYAFEAEPPFEITRMTTEPMLTASHNDPHVYGGPSTVWPGGSIFRDGNWTISMGINDEACGWMKIPHADVISQMEFV